MSGLVAYLLCVTFVADALAWETNDGPLFWRGVGRAVQGIYSRKLRRILQAATMRAIDEHTIVVRRGLWD